MPNPYTEAIRVRSYECDMYGHVNNAVYLHYLEEANLSALDASGLGPNWLAQADLYPWMTQVDIEYRQPLFYGETVEVTTRLDGEQDGTFCQTVEFHKAGKNEPAARATTGLVFLSRTNGKKRSIPREATAAFSIKQEPKTGGDPNSAVLLNPLGCPGERITPAPPPPTGVFATRYSVSWMESNAMQHVGHAVLLAYIEDCARQVVAAYGWPRERMQEQGFAVLLRRNQIEYARPARVGDEIEIATWFSNVRRVTATRYYRVTRVKDGETLAWVYSLGVWVSLETGQPIRLPLQLLADFSPNRV